MMESTQQSTNERSASQSMRSESVHTIINKIAEGETLPTQTVMKYEMLRFQTFRSFPRENKPFITRLAQAGFCYTKNGDEVVCYCCTKKKRNWQESDNPMDVHRELDPNCRFLINNAEVNVPITFREQGQDDSSSSTEANSRSQVGEHCECSEENSSRENLGSARNHTCSSSDNNSSDSERNTQNVNVQNRQTVDTVREDQLLQNRRSTLTDFSGTERRNQPFTLREADCPVSLRESQPSNSTTAAGSVTPPKHPKYASMTVRLSSFSDCREIVVRPEHLAEAGFFYAGFGDCVRCFQCGLGLRHWSEEDDPWIEHARWSKECSFVRQNRGTEFVNLVQMAVRYSQQENGSRQSFTGENQGAANADENDQLMHTNAAQSVLEMGYDPGIIRRAIQQVIASSGRKSLNAANLMEKIFEIEESAVVVQQSSVNNDTQRNQNELPERNNAVKQSKDVALTSSENGCGIDTKEKSSQSQKNGSAPALVTRSTTSPPAVKGATVEDSSAARKAYLLEKKRLKQENERLKQESICAKCKKNLVSIVFLPCGHLITCEDCAPTVKHCLVETCGKYIKDMLEVNFARYSFVGLLITLGCDIQQVHLYYDSARSRVCEDFLGYANCPATTGEALANAFVENLEAAGVDLRKMRGQGYDGAANMAGKYRGVQARIRQIIPRAIYTHCKAHSLNLAIIHASKEPLARNMMGTVQEIAFLFDYSAKRLLHFQATLAENDQDRAEMGKRQKLQTLCETRWAARADALYTFITAYGTVVESLERLSENNDTKAGTYRAAITQFSFIITLVAVEHVLSGCVPLSKLLQSTTCDLVQAATEAEVVKTQVTAERNDPLVWDTLFEKAVSMADSVGVQPSLPRGGRQQHRPNAPAQTPAEYWRINMYLPFVDHLVSELENRLLQNNERYTIQFLLPDKVANLDPEKMADIYAAAQEDLEDDLQTFIRECGRWKTRCESTVTQNPFTLESVLQGMPRDLYPNVSRCLHLLLAMPVSTANAERSFSSMRRLKTFLRSTMTTGRLSGLGLLHIHRDKEIQTEVVVDTFARRKNRRLALLFAN